MGFHILKLRLQHDFHITIKNFPYQSKRTNRQLKTSQTRKKQDLNKTLKSLEKLKNS